MKDNKERVIIAGQELRDKVAMGIEAIYGVAKSAYGAGAGNVMIEYRMGDPMISRDGVTNVSALIIKDPVANMVVQTIRQASKKTDTTAGDGTTLSVLLAKYIYDDAFKYASANGVMAASRRILGHMQEIMQRIDKVSYKASEEDLIGVASISCGDAKLGRLIYDTLKDVGINGGVNIREYGGLGVRADIVDGFYLDRGLATAELCNNYTGLQYVAEDAAIVILDEVISRQDQILPILNKLAMLNLKKIVFIGDIVGDALTALISNHRSGSLVTTVITPAPAGREIIMQDLAKYVDGEVFSGDTTKYDVERYAGRASIVATMRDTIFSVEKPTDKLKSHTASLEAELTKAEGGDIAAIETRLNRIRGRIANIDVGGATDVERQEVKLRVQDAVCAIKSAHAGGVVAGGGVCLRDIGDKMGLTYLTMPYDTLLENAGIPLTKGVEKDSGINLVTGETVNMLDAHILDPAIVVKEAIRNSHSVISQLITAQLALPYANELKGGY